MIAQLRNAIGLMELKSQDTLLTNTSSYVLPIVYNQESCDPLDIVRIGDRHIIYCLQSQTLISCDLLLNHTFLSGSDMICESLFLFQYNSHHITNFVLSLDVEQVLFANRGYLYGVKYDRSTLKSYSNLSSINSGSLVDRLVYSGDHTILAYSGSELAVQLNLDSERVDHVFNLLSSTGVKFTCGQPGNTFIVKQNLHDTEITYASHTFISKGTHFDAGSCMTQPGTSPSFLIIDSVAGLSILNVSSQTLYPISDSCSLSSQCKDVLVYPGPYLVVLRSGLMDEAVVYNKSLQVVIKGEQTMSYSDVALLFDLVPGGNPEPGGEGEGTTKGENTGEKPGGNRGNNEYVYIVVAVAVAVAILGTIIIVVAAV